MLSRQFMPAKVSAATLAAIISLSASLFAQANKLPDPAAQALATTKDVTLYSLDPEPGNIGFHGYKILGEVELNQDEAIQAVSTFWSAVENFNGAVAACFNPRHGLRVQMDGKAYDFVICYQCQQAEVYENKYRIGWVGITGSPAILNEQLTAADIPLSPVN